VTAVNAAQAPEMGQALWVRHFAAVPALSRLLAVAP
jgi:hypothetical protein